MVSAKMGSDEQFIKLLDRVTYACYAVSVWIVIENSVMFGVGQDANNLVSILHFAVSRAFEVVSPAVIAVGLIGVAISLVFGYACFRAGEGRSSELRNLGVVWLVSTTVLAVLIPVSMSTMNSGLLVARDNWVTSAFSVAAAFSNWLVTGVSSTPMPFAPVLSYSIKLVALAALMVTAYKMGGKTRIEFLRDASPMVFLGILFALVGAVAFVFFGVGLGRVKMEGMDIYGRPKGT